MMFMFGVLTGILITMSCTAVVYNGAKIIFVAPWRKH